MKLRALVKQALDDGIYFNACSFADKLVTMSAGLPEDVLLLARCHVAQGDHRQALDALRKYRLFDADTLLLFDQDGNNPAMNHSATTGSAGAGGLSGEKSHHAGGSQGGHGSSNNNNNNNNGGGGGKEGSGESGSAGGADSSGFVSAPGSGGGLGLELRDGHS